MTETKWMLPSKKLEIIDQCDLFMAKEDWPKCIFNYLTALDRLGYLRREPFKENPRIVTKPIGLNDMIKYCERTVRPNHVFHIYRTGGEQPLANIRCDKEGNVTTIITEDLPTPPDPANQLQTGNGTEDPTKAAGPQSIQQRTE